MNPIRDIIIKVPEAYNSSLTLKSGLVLFLDQNIKQAKDTIRYGEVLSVPGDIDLDIKIGDTLFVHHGIVVITVMENQPDIDSSFMIDKEERLYRVPMDRSWPLAYAVIRGGIFMCLEGICFIRPLKTKKYDTSIYIPGNEKELKHLGEVVYSNRGLRAKGVMEGSKVVFSKNSEYQFSVDGEELYCMFDRWILCIYEG